MNSEADKSKETGKDKGGCACPFCDAPVEQISPLCKACGVTISRCEICGKPLPKNVTDCPDCSS